MLELCIKLYIMVYGYSILKTTNMSENGHIVYTENSRTVLHKYRRKIKMLKTASSQKEASNKLMKGLLDLIILQFLNNQPMHGYQIITKIRKNFGVYFGPSTIYPLLGTLEKKGLVKSVWNMDFDRPRRIYSLTTNGQNMLNFTEESLNLICRKISLQTKTDLTSEPSVQTVIGIIPKRDRSIQQTA
jgi:PadR family transcriptional regulator, regulatory protein PadR